MAVASLFGGLALSNAVSARCMVCRRWAEVFPLRTGDLCGVAAARDAMNLRALRQRDPNNAALPRYDEVAWWLTAIRRQSRRRREMGSRAGRRFESSRLGSLHQREHFADLVAKAANASSMKANPIVLAPEELTEILEQRCKWAGMIRSGIRILGRRTRLGPGL